MINLYIIYNFTKYNLNELSLNQFILNIKSEDKLKSQIN
jgi:hypothetical protein